MSLTDDKMEPRDYELDARGQPLPVRPEHSPAERPPYKLPSTERQAKALIVIVCVAVATIAAVILIAREWVTNG